MLTQAEYNLFISCDEVISVVELLYYMIKVRIAKQSTECEYLRSQLKKVTQFSTVVTFFVKIFF